MTTLFDRPLLNKIGLKMLSRKESLGVAESVTCGLLQFSLSNIPDASKFLQGGLTAYNLAQKYRHLHVEPLHAMEVNCVSQQVADQMALQITELLASDWGIAVTGYATPAPESHNKLFAYYSIVYKKQVIKKGKIPGRSPEPAEVQRDYVVRILQAFARLL